MMNNLNLLRHPVATSLIYARGHRVEFRVPYWSCDGAIEFVFNMLQMRLQMKINGVDVIIRGMPSFKR